MHLLADKGAHVYTYIHAHTCSMSEKHMYTHAPIFDYIEKEIIANT